MRSIWGAYEEHKDEEHEEEFEKVTIGFFWYIITASCN
jgi:hypothetical protein